MPPASTETTPATGPGDRDRKLVELARTWDANAAEERRSMGRPTVSVEEAVSGPYVVETWEQAASELRAVLAAPTGTAGVVPPWLLPRLRLGMAYDVCQSGCVHCGAGPDEPCQDEACPCWPYSQDDEAGHRLADEVHAALVASLPTQGPVDGVEAVLTDELLAAFQAGRDWSAGGAAWDTQHHARRIAARLVLPAGSPAVAVVVEGAEGGVG